MKRPLQAESRIRGSLSNSDESTKRSNVRDELSKVRWEFNDEFAPSEVEFSILDPSAINNPLVRHFFYNHQIHETLWHAINRAAELGFPRVEYTFGLGFSPINNKIFRWIAAFGHKICPSLEEGGEDWLCVQCYLRWIGACWTFTDGPVAPPKPTDMTGLFTEEQIEFRNRSMAAQSVAECMFFLGAAVRELELHKLNRTDALRGKKTVRSAKRGGAVRQSALADDKTRRLAEMQRLVLQLGVSGAAEALFRKGLGTSADANRQLWYRNRA